MAQYFNKSLKSIGAIICLHNIVHSNNCTYALIIFFLLFCLFIFFFFFFYICNVITEI